MDDDDDARLENIQLIGANEIPIQQSMTIDKIKPNPAKKIKKISYFF
jgi:hypothetical protein